MTSTKHSSSPDETARHFFQQSPNFSSMARKDITMTPEEVTTFLGEQMTLLVATLGKDGFPHVAPMWFVLEDGAVVFRSFTKSQKMVNLRRDPRLTVLAEDGLDYAELRGVMIKGTARLITDRDYVLSIYGKLAARYPMVGGESLDLEGEALEAAFGRFADKNTAVVVEPERVISWDHRKLGGAY
jgi:PPOX class probable F420-dependent enzyme